MNNYDRIKSMSVDEMASAILMLSEKVKKYPNVRIKLVKQWLLQEVSEKTDNEIIKALKYCAGQGITSECEGCKYKKGCRPDLIIDALALINRQKADVERLEEELDGETVKNMRLGHEIERLKNEKEKSM